MKKKIKYFKTTPCKKCARAIEERNKSPEKNLCCWCFEEEQNNYEEDKEVEKN